MLKKILLLSAMSVISFDNSNASMVEYNNDQERRAMIQFRSYYDNSIELFKQSSLAAQINDNPHNKELNINVARTSFERANRFMDQNMNNPNAPKVFNNEDIINMYRHCMTLYILTKGYHPEDASLYLRMAISRADLLKPITYEMSEELYKECDYFSKYYLQLATPIQHRIANDYNVTENETFKFKEYKEKYDRWVNDAESFRYKGYFESFTNAVTPVALKFWDNRDKIETLGAMLWNIIPTTNTNISNNQLQPNANPFPAVLPIRGNIGPAQGADARFELDIAKQLLKCVNEGDYKGAKQLQKEIVAIDDKGTKHYLNYDKK